MLLITSQCWKSETNVGILKVAGVEEHWSLLWLALVLFSWWWSGGWGEMTSRDDACWEVWHFDRISRGCRQTRLSSAILFLIPEEPEGKLMQPQFESLFHLNSSDLALLKGIYFCQKASTTVWWICTHTWTPVLRRVWLEGVCVLLRIKWSPVQVIWVTPPTDPGTRGGEQEVEEWMIFKLFFCDVLTLFGLFTFVVVLASWSWPPDHTWLLER